MASWVGTRINKSRSMMISLYTLSGLSLLILLSFLISTVFHILFSVETKGLLDVGGSLQSTFSLISLGLLLSFPFAASITYLLVSRLRTRSAPFLFSIMKLTGQAPVVLFGLVFLFLFGDNEGSLVLTVALLSLAQLVRRWTELSCRVELLEIESMQSLGMQIWQIIYYLYIKRFFKLYLFHALAVFCYLFVLVTPFLCFQWLDSESLLFARQLYQNLGSQLRVSASYAALIFSIHGLRVWIDHKTSFWEVEYS